MGSLKIDERVSVGSNKDRFWYIYTYVYMYIRSLLSMLLLALEELYVEH